MALQLESTTRRDWRKCALSASLAFISFGRRESPNFSVLGRPAGSLLQEPGKARGAGVIVRVYRWPEALTATPTPLERHTVSPNSHCWLSSQVVQQRHGWAGPEDGCFHQVLHVRDRSAIQAGAGRRFKVHFPAWAPGLFLATSQRSKVAIVADNSRRDALQRTLMELIYLHS